MCDICVMNAVKTKMLSRRNFFKSAAGGALAAAAGTGLAGPAQAAGMSMGMKPADMTHTYDENFPTYFGAPGISKDQKFNFADNGFNLFELTINEHTGTHIDAPLHFSADGNSVDEIPVESLVAPLCVIDIKARAAENPDAQVTPDDIKAWIAANGDIPAGACVAMNSGWDKHVNSDKFRGADADGKMHFPGFHIEATRMLMEETGAASMAVDTLSLDFGLSADFATHYAWLPSGRFGIENIANLDAVPAAGATLVIGAPKHRGGSGGPARIIALM
ncbi:MAG TPA: cyclase family protein [Aliiroseovarius sp.]|nr:cyclase family protein [Aliiroseovarius sp.]